MLAETCRWISSFLFLSFNGSWQDFQNGSIALSKNARNHSDLRLFNDQALWRRLFAFWWIKRLQRALWPLGGPESKNKKTMFEGWCIYYPSNVIKHKHSIMLTELAARGSAIPTASLLQLQSCAVHCVRPHLRSRLKAHSVTKKCREMKKEKMKRRKTKVCLLVLMGRLVSRGFWCFHVGEESSLTAVVDHFQLVNSAWQPRGSQTRCRVHIFKHWLWHHQNLAKLQVSQ